MMVREDTVDNKERLRHKENGRKGGAPPEEAFSAA